MDGAVPQTTSPAVEVPTIAAVDAARPVARSGAAATGDIPPFRLHRLLRVVDLVTVAVGWAVVVATVPQLGGWSTVGVAVASLALALAAPYLLAASGLYRLRLCSVRTAELARIIRTSLWLAAVVAAITFDGDLEEATDVAGVSAAVWVVLLAAERGMIREWMRARQATGAFATPVVVAGGDTARVVQTARFLADNPFLGYAVVGLATPVPPVRDDTLPWLGTVADLRDLRARWGAADVVVDTSGLAPGQLNELLQRLSDERAHAHVATGLRGIDRRRVTLSPVADETFLYVAPLRLRRSQMAVKRTVDVVLGSFLLVLSSPLLLVTAALIRLHDRGPVLYRQRRVGLEGEPFWMLKFRTMRPDADRLLEDLRERNARTGPLFKLARDPRVTPIGRFLRASSIDELPQLVNVVRGTMSLVGPRPSLPEEAAAFDADLQARLRVKPGITGLWQVEARDLTNFDLYRRFDLLYVQNWSLALDVAILARTVPAVLLRTLRALTPFRGLGILG